jgi:hypothetical protein
MTLLLPLPEKSSQNFTGNITIFSQAVCDGKQGPFPGKKQRHPCENQYITGPSKSSKTCKKNGHIVIANILKLCYNNCTYGSASLDKQITMRLK